MSIERNWYIDWESLEPEQKSRNTWPAMVIRGGHKYSLQSHNGDVGTYKLNETELIQQLQVEIATMQATMQEQSAVIADMRQKLRKARETLNTGGIPTELKLRAIREIVTEKENTDNE